MTHPIQEAERVLRRAAEKRAKQRAMVDRRWVSSVLGVMCIIWVAVILTIWAVA